MYNCVSASVASKLDGKEISVRDFLASDWTDHVFLVPEDYATAGFCGCPVTRTKEESERLLRERYIDSKGVYIIREKDFGDCVSYWVYFGVIVSRFEYESANSF